MDINLLKILITAYQIFSQYPLYNYSREKARELRRVKEGKSACKKTNRKPAEEMTDPVCGGGVFSVGESKAITRIMARRIIR
jgi:hypothetical protein